MFPFQNPTPDTSAYMIAGYVLAFTVMAIYLASLWIRKRNLQRDLAMLEELQAERAQRDARPPAPRSKPGASPARKKK